MPLPCCALRAKSSRRVDVGGYRLYLSCAGKGSPSVLLDAGMGDASPIWSEVVPRVAKFTRVCSYDRAGLGRSEPGPSPRTSSTIVEEMRRLLDAADIPPPYVLVGHSFGGLNVRLFAARYPERTAGLVLVDATHEDYPARESALRSPTEKRSIARSFGMASPAARSEFESIEDSAHQVRSGGRIPDVPFVVVTAGRRVESPQLQQLWEELQSQLARLGKSGKQIIADRSGHYVQYDQPELVAAAIREVVLQANERLGLQTGGAGTRSGRP